MPNPLLRRSADHDGYDLWRDDLAVPDVYEIDFIPLFRHGLIVAPNVSRHISAGTSAPLLRAGTTSTGSSAATLTGAGAVEPSDSQQPRDGHRAAA